MGPKYAPRLSYALGAAVEGEDTVVIRARQPVLKDLKGEGSERMNLAYSERETKPLWLS